MANIFGIEFPSTAAVPVATAIYAGAQSDYALSPITLTSSYQQIDFNTDLGSSGITVDTTAGTIEILTTGKYLVSFTSVCNNTGASNVNIDIRIRQNGNDLTSLMYGAVNMIPATAETVSFSNLCDLTAGDIINCESLSGGAGTANVVSVTVWLYKIA